MNRRPLLAASLALSAGPLAVLAVAAHSPGAGSDDSDEVELERLRDEVAVEVEELRGLEFKEATAVAVRTKEEFAGYVVERADKSQPAVERRADEEAARLLGLIPIDMDLEATLVEFASSQVGGYYEPSEDTFYLVEGAGTGALLEIILAHELTHALDDQHFDIDGTLLPLGRTNADAAAAYHAVVEGSGTSVMNVWTVRKMTSGELSMADLMEASSQDFGDAPAFVWKPLLHSYLRGAAFLARTDSVMKGQTSPPDPRDINRAFEAPPTSTEQILHPEKYWDPEQRDEPTPVAFELSGLAEGWTVGTQNTMGELLLSIVTTPWKDRGPVDPMKAIGVPFTNDIAAGWDGDRYLLLENEGARILHLVTIWDSELDADEFALELQNQRGLLEERARALGDGVGEVRLVEPGIDEVVLTVATGVEGKELDRVLATLAVR